MEQTLKIGLVVKPQGIRGELKVMPLTDDVKRFKQLKSVLIDGVTYKVLGARPSIDSVFILLDGVTDRNVAETFRNKFLCVKKQDAVALPKDSYFIVDIEGCKLYDENGEIGTVREVTSAKTDYFTVDTVDNRVLRFPFLKDLIIKIDTDSKEIYVKGERLKEISVYED